MQSWERVIESDTLMGNALLMVHVWAWASGGSISGVTTHSQYDQR